MVGRKSVIDLAENRTMLVVGMCSLVWDIGGWCLAVAVESVCVGGEAGGGVL
jgi:hypothetical protein